MRTTLPALLATLFLVALPASSLAQTQPAAPRPPAKKSRPAGPAKPAAARPVEMVAPAPVPEPPPPPPPADVRMKTVVTQGPQQSENVTYVRGERQRVEFPGVVSIEQCDLGRTVMLNLQSKRYRVQKHAAGAGPAAAGATAGEAPAGAGLAFGAEQGYGSPSATPRGGVVTMATTSTDTLERQSMFGFEARRVKTVMVKQFGPNTCDTEPLAVEIDAWYIDLPVQTSCVREAAPGPPPASSGACIDRLEHRVAGDVKLGFPVKMATTTKSGGSGREIVASTSQEVTELEVTRLDAALFDVPADFVEAASGAEIVPAIAAGGSLADALFGTTADGSGRAAPKKPGVIRIGVLEPVNRTTRAFPAGALRRELAGLFHKAPYEALPVSGTSAAAVEQDAIRLECDYILLTEIVEAKTSKPGKLGGMMSLAGGGGPPRDKHEVRIAYKLFDVRDTQSPKAGGIAKASSGGAGLGSALRLAAFAGQMYVGGMGMGAGLRGFGGMMSPMLALSTMGGPAASLGVMGTGLMDPRSMAVQTLALGLAGAATPDGGMDGGFGDPSDEGLRATMAEALESTAKGAMDQLARKR